MQRIVSQRWLLLFFVLLVMSVGCGNDNDGILNQGDDDQTDDDDTVEDLGYVPILDEEGRTLILHGCNYMGMEFGWFEHTPEDFERIAGWGFNVVRLPIAWHYLEPEQGIWDISYLEEIVEPVIFQMAGC